MLTSVFEFLVLTVYAWRIITLRGRYLLELLSASFFGLTLEYFNILINDNYHYSERFFLQLGKAPVNVPIVIAMGWGLIITASISLTNYLGVGYRPISDAVIALSIDLSMDVIAIRIEGGFWKWEIPLLDYPTNQGFFGVPWGNLTSWLYVVLIYSVVIRHSRRCTLDGRLYIYFTLAPVVAYLPLFAIIGGSIALYFALGLRELVGPVIYQLVPIVIAVLIFVSSYVRVLLSSDPSSLRTMGAGSDQTLTDPNSFTTSFPIFLIFHLYFLLVYLILGMWSTIPSILWLELFLMGFALILHLPRKQFSHTL